MAQGLLKPKSGKERAAAEARVMSLDAAGFAAARKQVESYLNRTYMRQANPPIGVNPRLITWMAVG